MGLNYDSEIKIKGAHSHGTEAKFKPLRVLLVGDDTHNEIIVKIKQELRDIGHDVITKSADEFSINKLKEWVKDYNVIYQIPDPIKAHTPLPPEPDDEDEEEIITDVDKDLGEGGLKEEAKDEIEEEDGDEGDDDSEGEVDVPGQDEVIPPPTI